MNTEQLLCVLSSIPSMKVYDINVFALDQFKEAKLENMGIYICNNQPSTMEGGHWFLIVIQNDNLYFIDSFARKPSYYKIEKKLKNLKENRILSSLKDPLQSNVSNLCGEYCLFFSYHLSRKMHLEDILNKYFTNDFVKNDQKVQRFVWKIFPGHEREHTTISSFWCNRL